MKTPAVLSVLPLLGIMVACSSGPPSPKPGSAGFFWAVARESYRTGDLARTNTTLLELSRNPSAFTDRARIWQVVVSAGLSQGYSDLADAYEAGGRVNLTSPQRFHTQASTLRSMATSAAMDFAQAMHETAAVEKDQGMLLAFGYPTGSAEAPDALKRLAEGIWPSDAEREALQAAMMQRGVLLAASRAVGSPDNPTQARAAFQTPEVRVPRSTFIFEMAGLMYKESALFAPERLDRPNRLMLMCGEAVLALRSIPQTSETTALTDEIQAQMKKVGGL